MSDDERITVAEVSEGPGGVGQPGTDVSLPVVELLTGRGFVTGKSGSGKSNTASVIAENLLDAGFGLLIVDIDGEYYGLKEEYEILHVGADEECDIQVTTEHAEKIANLALEQNVPIILDISSFLDDEEAAALLREVSKHLFAKAKKLKQPFLMLVEEVHEWIPENGSVGEVGKMLIKIGKRGRKHGLGIVGISQRPADVKKDYITQCDWLVWHRLTWNNDTKVVRRVLDGEYASAVEDLNNGEAFLMTDWSESVRRVQFHRKQTFDAGATPGLDDFERPELKSVSDDLVSELESISEEKQQRDSTIEELREELDKKNSRIAELETELQDARDLSRMADQFVDAMLDQVQHADPGRTETERMRARRQRRYDGTGDVEQPDGTDDQTSEADGGGFEPPADVSAWPDQDPDPGGETNGTGRADGADDTVRADDAAQANDGGSEDPEAAFAEAMDAAAGGDAFQFGDEEESGAKDDGREDDEGSRSDTSVEDSDRTEDEGDFPNFEEPTDMPHLEEPRDATFDFSDADLPEFGFETPEEASTNGSTTNGHGGTASAAGGVSTPEPDGSDDEAIAQAVSAVDGDHSVERERPTPAAVEDLRETIRSLAEKTRRMLAYYDEHGPTTPLDAHFVAGGTGDRTDAYAHNRELRLAGLVEHVGRGKYDTCIRERLDNATDGRLDDDELAVYRAQLAADYGVDGF